MSRVGEDLETLGLGEVKEEGIHLNGAGQFLCAPKCGAMLSVILQPLNQAHSGRRSGFQAGITFNDCLVTCTFLAFLSRKIVHRASSSCLVKLPAIRLFIHITYAIVQLIRVWVVRIVVFLLIHGGTRQLSIFGAIKNRWHRQRPMAFHSQSVFSIYDSIPHCFGTSVMQDCLTAGLSLRHYCLLCCIKFKIMQQELPIYGGQFAVEICKF